MNTELENKIIANKVFENIDREVEEQKLQIKRLKTEIKCRVDKVYDYKIIRCGYNDILMKKSTLIRYIIDYINPCTFRRLWTKCQDLKEVKSELETLDFGTNYMVRDATGHQVNLRGEQIFTTEILANYSVSGAPDRDECVFLADDGYIEICTHEGEIISRISKAGFREVVK